MSTVQTRPQNQNLGVRERWRGRARRSGCVPVALVPVRTHRRKRPCRARCGSLAERPAEARGRRPRAAAALPPKRRPARREHSGPLQHPLEPPLGSQPFYAAVTAAGTGFPFNLRAWICAALPFSQARELSRAVHDQHRTAARARVPDSLRRNKPHTPTLVASTNERIPQKDTLRLGSADDRGSPPARLGARCLSLGIRHCPPWVSNPLCRFVENNLADVE
jgi:hypothetical protein